MDIPNNARFDVDAYLRRIGYTGRRTPSAETLEALHLAHATTVPFENADILLGRPIRLDIASLQTKLVGGHRGGYCFEQNLLFLAALEALGFLVTPLAARVRFGHRVVREGDSWVLQSLLEQQWKDLYAFTLEPQHVVDYELASYYVSTHPDSPFVQRLTVQLPTPEARYVLRQRDFVIDRGDAISQRTIASDEELLDLLATRFGLRFPPETRFP